MVEKNEESYLVTNNLSKSFGTFEAIRNISINIQEGEFVCFLGPSGCGKTTLLRCIAGLEIQSTGSVIQKKIDISNLPPSSRDFGIVFQSYALFPNLSVFSNIAYGLVNNKWNRHDINKRVGELLDLVSLTEHAKKYPSQLSGGEQQRVALARALATSPGLLLLDEPLGALDLKLREQMQVELKVLQRQFNITFIYVTHDQQEALSMSDRIAVFNEGNIEQVDTPANIYLSPKSSFIANFVGTTNVINKDIASNNFKLTKSFSIRPENISIIKSDKNYDYYCSGSVIESQFQGSLYKIILKTSFNQQFIINSKQPYEINSNIKFGWFEKDIIIFD